MPQDTPPGPEALIALLDAMPLPAVLIRRDERIEAANQAAQTLLGPGIAGRHFITVLRQPTLLDAIEASLRDAAPRTTRYLTSDGAQDTTFHVHCGPLDLGSDKAVLVSFQDITPVETAGQMRRDFVANVSHELRTPLTALLGFIETLRGPARDDAPARERFLGVMASEAERMNRLVGDLLSLSRVEGEERVRPTETVDLAALLRSCVHGLMPLARAGEVALSVDLPEGGVSVLGDPDQLQQVFTNLTENAIKYGPPGTSVTLSVAEPAYAPELRRLACRVIVRDTGPGIDAIHLPRLTERFYRVDDHRARAQGGTGLGLAIVKHIVNRHRGRLRIDSTPGQGTVVTVVLPVG